jgi:hypothetical protein
MKAGNLLIDSQEGTATTGSIYRYDEGQAGFQFRNGY